MILDPWCYDDRRTLIELLIFTTSTTTTTSTTSSATATASLSSRDRRTFTRGCVINTHDYDDNLLWGFLSQYLWQQRSGRLRMYKDFESDGNVQLLSFCSWWALMNYTLTVVPFVAAKLVEVDGLSDVSIDLARIRKYAPPRLAQCLLGMLDESHNVVQLWCEYFRFIQRSRDNIDMQQLCALQWRAHSASIHAGLEAKCFTETLNALPLPEREFAVGWCSMVDDLAAANILCTTRSLAEPTSHAALPHRELTLADDGDILDMTATPRASFIKQMRRLGSDRMVHRSRL